jgi:hypothetical protein
MMADEGTQTVVMSTQAGIPHGTRLETQEGMPDLVVKAVHPIQRMAIRVARVYVTALIGMLSLVMGNVAPGVLTPPTDFVDKLLVAMGFAIAPSVVQLVVNLGEALAQLDR